MAATVGTRRLAAILAADAEGFSRLMGTDEAATLATLAAHRDIIDGKVGEHGGTVVGSAGDSVLAEFTSVIQAVSCAVAIQDELGERNARLPDDRRMMFRVGVNLGDVIVEGGTIYGDGVNVAARLERLADPGGICVARGVHDQVKGKLPLAFTDMGEQRFKNIAEPVRAYRIERTRPSAVTRQAPPAEALPRPGRPSIAVLPFDNMSGERDQEYFSDGITEDITTELSQFHELFVIARNSSFTFKGKAVDVKAVAEKLGVQYVVEGSVRRAGDRVRITAQLVDADSGRHLWAQRFDRVLDDVFAIQDDVTQAIVAAIAPEVGAAERELARRARPESMRAWEAYQLGTWHFYHMTPEHSAQAKHWFRLAIERDANFAAAHAALAFAIYADAIHALAEAGAEARTEAIAAAQRAMGLDDRDAFVRAVVGRMCNMQGDVGKAVAEHQAAVAINRNLVMPRVGLSSVLLNAGRFEECVENVREVLRLSPRDPLGGFLKSIGAMALTGLGRPAEAKSWALEATGHANVRYWGEATLAMVLANLGEMAEARKALDRVLTIEPRFSLSFWRAAFFGRTEHVEFLFDAMRRLGVED